MTDSHYENCVPVVACFRCGELRFLAAAAAAAACGPPNQLPSYGVTGVVLWWHPNEYRVGRK